MDVAVHIASAKESLQSDGGKVLTLEVKVRAGAGVPPDAAFEESKAIIMSTLFSGNRLERATNESLSRQLADAEKRVRDLTYQLGIVKAENAALRASKGWRPRP